MKTKFFLVLFILIFLFIGMINTGCQGKIKLRNAKHRVETVLKGITKEEGRVVGDEETAVCMWWKNVIRIGDGRELEQASDEFDRWMNDAGMPSYISDFTVDEAEIVGNDVVVSGTIEGSYFKVQVPEERKISWIEKPEF